VIYLGISQDRYDAGVCLSDGRRLVYAANEERFTRRKNQGGFPRHALADALRHTGVGAGDVERICIAGIMTPPLPARLFPRIQEWLYRNPRPSESGFANLLVDWLAFRTGLAHTEAGSRWRSWTASLLPPVMRRSLDLALRSARMDFVEHHHAHAAAAWHLSGFEDALVITADGMGDGLSMTVSRWGHGGSERLWSAGSRDSLGLFYSVITEALGFIPDRHEGKITGLAAHGVAHRVSEPVPFVWEGERLRFSGYHGRRAVAWARSELIPRYDRIDIAAWVQEILESNIVRVANHWLRATGLRRLAAGGGVFANVKLNQRLHEISMVDEIFVCPNMGDGGLAVGAVAAHGGLNEPVEDVFLGDEHSAASIAAALAEQGFVVAPSPDIDAEVATCLAAGKIVARFRGRMEWGPRALGNRSVLASASDRAVVERLNRLLRRSDFMPFAPAILESEAGRMLVGIDGAWRAAEFMTVCCNASEAMRREFPAVVHVDGTVRPQIVREAANPSFDALLRAYQRRTGAGVVLNTSFNIHEEPIVRTPREAIDSFLRAGLDALAIGPFLVHNPRAGEP